MEKKCGKKISVAEWREYYRRKYAHDVDTYRQKLAVLLYAKTQRKVKRCHIRSILKRRRELGYQRFMSELRLCDVETFFKFHGMSPNKFDELLGLLGKHLPALRCQKSNYIIKGSERLSITLRYLVAADIVEALSFSIKVSKEVVTHVITSTCGAIWTVLRKDPDVFPPPTEELWLANKERFFKECNFPNCIGAMGGTKICIQALKDAGSINFDYNDCECWSVHGACDLDYCFTLLYLGTCVEDFDDILWNSGYCYDIAANNINIPGPALIPGSKDRNLPHVFVADSAFPMSDHLLRPYSPKDLTDEQIVFNYRASRASMLMAETFGIIAARWKIFHSPVLGTLQTVKPVAMAVMCLHNFMQREDMALKPSRRRYCPPALVARPGADGASIPGKWRELAGEHSALESYHPMGHHRYTPALELTRSQLVEYFNDEGQIPGQRERGKAQYGELTMKKLMDKIKRVT